MKVSTGRIRLLVGAASAVCALVAILPSCGADDPNAADGNGTNNVGAFCATPNDGCPCTDIGATIPCGKVEHRSGDKVLCSEGSRTCNGNWTNCTSDTIRVRNVSQIHTQALGPRVACGNGTPNLCDPYCNQFEDDVVGLVVDGGGLCVGPGGVTVGCADGGAPPASGICRLPLDSLRTYCRQANGAAWVLDPVAGCLAGEPAQGPANARPACAPSPDNCDYDAFCGAGNKCQFFPPAGKNPAVPGIDFTIGQPCGPPNTGGQNLFSTICNRGNTPWAGGNISVSVGNAVTAVPTCGQQSAGGPIGNRTGTCTYNYPPGLAPGECFNIEFKPLFCPGLGTTWDVNGNQIAIVNDPSVGGASPGTPAARLPEANTCNNSVAFKHTDILACNASGSCGSNIPPTAIQTTNNGLSNCSGGSNRVTNPCNAGNELTNCQQDHHCDIPTSTCVWNGAAGYFDPAAGGPDLTIGAACNPPAGGELLPICNRGSVAVPAGAPIAIHVNNGTPYANACAPGDAATCNGVIPAGGLAPGACFNFPCNNNGNDYAVLVAPTVAEGARCANNQAYTKTQGTPGCASCISCDTKITGRVFDPSGASPTANANNVGLANIAVFQPVSTTLTAINDNPLAGPPPCDTCASLSSPAIAQTLTNPDGTFTLSGVTPGPNKTLVVQTGRWRRQFAIGNVAACGTTVLTPGVARLPKSRTDGFGGVADIPKIALSLGAGETLECLLRRIGIADSEFVPGNAVAAPERFHIYRSSGMQTSPAAPQVNTLYQAGGRIGAYSAMLGSCDFSNPGNAWVNMTSAPAGTSDRDRMMTYANQGGRLFLDHRLGESFP